MSGPVPPESPLERLRRLGAAPSQGSGLDRLRSFGQPADAAPQQSLADRAQALRAQIPTDLAAKPDASARRDVTAPEPQSSLPFRVAEGMGEFAQQVRHDPKGVLKSIVLDPLRALDKASRPVEGRPYEGGDRYDAQGNVRTTQPKFGTTISRDQFDDAITEKEAALGAAQVATEIGAGFAFKPLRNALLKQGMKGTGATLATSAAVAAPVGAVYSPDDPAAGALMAGLFGVGAGAAGTAIGKAVPTVVRGTVRGAQATARGLEQAGQAAQRFGADVGDVAIRARQRSAGGLDKLRRMASDAMATEPMRSQPLRIDPQAARMAGGIQGQRPRTSRTPDAILREFERWDDASRDPSLSEDMRSHAAAKAAELRPEAQRAFDERVAASNAEYQARTGRPFPGTEGAASAPTAPTAARAGQPVAPAPTRATTQQGARRPSSVTTLSVSSIRVDPERFQFKLGTDPATGAGGELKGVQKFDRDLAGVVSVWRDPASGETFVVNGHHRVELARRLGVEDLDVRYIEAPTAQAARARGALINLAEGRGTPIDAAKFLRDTGMSPDELSGAGLSLRGALVRDGVALAKLPADLFDRVARGEMDMGNVAAMGRVLDSEAQIRAAVGALDRHGKRLTDSQATELARQVRDAGETAITQETLFGAEQSAQSLWVEKAQLVDALKKDFASDKRLFGFVSREGRAEALARGGNVIDVEGSAQLAQSSAMVSELFDRLASRSGPLAGILNDGARRLAHGESIKAVKASLSESVRATLSDALTGGESGRAGGDPGDVSGGAIAPDRPADPSADVPPGAFDEETGRVRDSADPAQDALFMPSGASRQGPRSASGGLSRLRRIAQEPRGDTPDVLAEPDLFGNRTPADIDAEQGGLFGGQEGTAAARSLSQTEIAARARLDRIRQELPLQKDQERRAKLAREAAELQKLVDRDKAISAEELANRAAADKPLGPDTPPPGPDQGMLFAPISMPSKVHQALTAHNKALGVTSADVRSLYKISRDLAEAVGVPLRQGRGNLGRLHALGAFFVKPEVIRVRRIRQVTTVAHEVGHYVSKKYDLKTQVAVRQGKGQRQLTGTMGKELWQMGKNLYGSRRPAGGYAEEGVAEWFKFWVTDRARAMNEAPDFTAWSIKMLENEPVLRAALDRAHDDWARFQAAPAAEKISANISVGERIRHALTAKQFLTAVFDDLTEIRTTVKELGQPKSIKADGYALSRLSRGDAGLSRDMLERGVIDFTNRKRVTRGLVEILNDVTPAKWQALREYMTARQVLTKTGQGIDTGFDVNAAKEVVRQLGDDPLITKAADELWAYRSALVDYLAGAGLLLPNEVKAMRIKNRTPTPFYRVIDPNETGRSLGESRARAKSGSGIKRLEGSDRPIVDPLESLIKDTYNIVSRANKHHAAQQLVKHALRTEGGGKYIDLLPEIPKEMRQINVSKVLDQLEELGFEIDPNTLTVEKAAEINDAMLTAFYEKKVPGPDEIGDLVMTVMVDGRRRWVQIKDRQLWDALNSMDVPELKGWMKLVEAPNQLLRAGAVLSPEFIGTNPLRDMLATSVFSQGRTLPPAAHFAQGLFHLLKKDEWYQRWVQEGGANAGMVGYDRMSAQLALREISEGKYSRFMKVFRYPVNVAHAFGTPMDWLHAPRESVGRGLGRAIEPLRAAAEIMENANRLGEFKEVYKAEVKRGTSDLEARKVGALASRDLIDFARAGTASRNFNRLTAFFNAYVQDLSKLNKELVAGVWKDPKRAARVYARATAFITMPSIALYLSQKDDPVYQELPEYVKGTGWVYIDRDENGELQRIYWLPRPHLLGMLFGYLPEKVMDWIGDRDPKALESLAHEFSKNATPPLMPTLVRPVLEIKSNRTSFGDRPIVPAQVQGLAPSEQAAPYTGEFSRAVGAALNVSPAQVEHAIGGYTGGLGRYATDAADALVSGQRKLRGLPARAPAHIPGRDKLDEVPLVKRFVQRPPGFGSRSLSQFYDEYEAAEQKRNTWRRLLTSDPQRARRYLEEHREAILSVASREDTGGQPGRARAFREVLNEIAAARRELMTAPLTEEEKLRRIAELEDRAADMARRYYELKGSVSVAY
jgi:hypothetical protein